MKFFISVLCLLTVSFAQAIEVLDPRGDLARINQYISPVDFEKAFTCGVQTEYSGNTRNCVSSCTGAVCKSQCFGENTPTGRFKVKLFTEDCTHDSVFVYGDNGLSIKVTKSDYLRGGSTLVVPLLKSIGHFIQPDANVTISMLFPMGWYDYVHDGIKEKIRGISVLADIEGVDTVEVVLAEKGQGVSQIILLKSGQSEFLRLKGVFNAQP